MSINARTKVHAEIKVNTKVLLEIQLKNDVNGMKTSLSLSSTVEKLLEDRSLLIHMPIHQGYHYPLPRDATILMIFFVDLDMYALPVQFQERIESDGFIFAKIRRLGRIEPHQRRDCYRLPCSLPIIVERFWNNERELYPERHPAEGMMIDFSDGGMLFATNENIEKGEKITLTFDFGMVEMVEGMALRTERIEDGKYLFKVAAQFRNKDKSQKSRFYKYIVDKQLEERRRWTSALDPLYNPDKEHKADEDA